MSDSCCLCLVQNVVQKYIGKIPLPRQQVPWLIAKYIIVKGCTNDINENVWFRFIVARVSLFTPFLCPSLPLSLFPFSLPSSLPSYCPLLTEPSIVQNTVYISYCPEANRRFKRQIKDLAQLLRRQRYTVFYDEFYSKREIRRYGGLDCWKERCISEAENVLVVCTPQYFDEDCMLSNPDLRQRITKSPLEVDCKLLRTVAYGRSSERLIPIILDRDRPQARSCLPIWMFSPPLFWPSGRNSLIRCIEGTPEYTIPEPRERIVIKPVIIDFPDAYKHNPRDMQ